tara:strand:- start:338 stop:730 length:393 start_codon:yes stop_codon:yes gene_type:complete
MSLEEARKKLKEASEKKQNEHFRKIYEEAGSELTLREHETLLEQDGHFLPVPGTRSPDEYDADFWHSISQRKHPDSGQDSLFTVLPVGTSYAGQLKSKKKRSKKKRSKKKSSKKKRSKKKRSKKRRSRKY